MSHGGTVSKYCSILNYLKDVDDELYNLIQDLCVGRALAPRRGSPGVTFLRPDKALVKDIKAMAEGDSPEDAVSAIQSLVLLDYLPSIDDFSEKKSDIPTFLKKKLPITSVDGKKVVLSNGAEIVADKGFNARADRSNLAVHIISKALVPEGESADFSNAKVKAKKGGAQLVGDGMTRLVMFEKIVSDMYRENSPKDSAMELLCSLYLWAKKNNQPLAELIASQISHDSLASLAILLQPYKTKGVTYIDDATLENFKTGMYSVDGFRNSPMYCFSSHMEEIYNKLASSSDFKDVADITVGAIDDLSDVVPANIVNKTKAAIDKVKNKLPTKRRELSAAELYSEGELRVLSGVLHDNSDGAPSEPEVLHLYRSCTLDQPYLLDNKPLIFGANIGFYMSTSLLVLLSGSYAHVPVSSDKSYSSDISDLVKADRFINLSESVAKYAAVKYRKRQSCQGAIAIKNMVDAFVAYN
jgi:hypothetical protein